MKNYIMKEHPVNLSIGRLGADDLLKFLNQSVAIITSMGNVDSEFKTVLENVKDSNSLEEGLTDDQIDELLELIEDSIIRDYDGIKVFYEHCYSTWEALNSYIRTTLFTIEAFNEISNKIVSSWTCPTIKEFKTLHNYCISIVTNLIFIIYFEFDMDSVNSEENGRFYIDEIYDKYCKQYGFDPETCTQNMSELKGIYKIRLDFFDEYPELEEPFETIMGPNLANTDEGKLTIGLVKQVLSGEISDSQLYDIVKYDDDDSAANTDISNTGNLGTNAGISGMNLF